MTGGGYYDPVGLPLRDEQGNVRLRVSCMQRNVAHKYKLSIYTLHGERVRRMKRAMQETVADTHPLPELARMLEGMCALVAIRIGCDYVVDNPDRLATLRSGRYSKPPAGRRR